MGSGSEDDTKTPSILAKVIGALVGACFGILTLSGLVKMAYPILETDAMRTEGQSGFAFILSAPIGMILGTAGGYVLMSQRTATHARRVLSVAGALSTILVLGIGLLSAGSRGLSVHGFLWTVASPWSLLPLIASVAILIVGFSFNKHA